MGVWIETQRSENSRESDKSHPAWVCGLKPCNRRMSDSVDIVTPCVGVWIETAMAARSMRLYRVTPCVGVWIETYIVSIVQKSSQVTPCVGVWIETIFINLVDVMD